MIGAGTGAAAGSHLDDLEALLQVADLHPDAGSFEAWLRRAFHRERAEGGVTLAWAVGKITSSWILTCGGLVTDQAMQSAISAGDRGS